MINTCQTNPRAWPESRRSPIRNLAVAAAVSTAAVIVAPPLFTLMGCALGFQLQRAFLRQTWSVLRNVRAGGTMGAEARC